jgi:uncharacterized membrane protein YbhN (UPF0104 family)
MRNEAWAIARAVRGKASQNRIGVAISLIIITAASVALFHLLRDIEPGKVVAALRATSAGTVLAAAGFVAAGYFTLTFYDFFALRTIGRSEIPYRVAALAGFTSYSIGHNVGATVFTGGMVRYRIYSAHGLTVIDVAKIAFVTGLTFWLGNAAVLGIGMAWAPEAASAVNQLPPAANRVIACAGLLAIVGYLAWLLPRPRVVGRDHWSVTLPNAQLTLVQIAIGILDLGSAALAMYTLLPAQPAIDFVPLLVTFVLSTLLGFASHAPGSIGVFDAAMLVGLQQFEKEQLLAAMLIFRFLYFVVPLSLALTALAVREASLARRNRRANAPVPAIVDRDGVAP